MIYKFRIILDAEEDVFRDLEVESGSSMEDFHNSIAQSFGFDGTEMASFYISNEEWEQGEEIALFDMSEGEDRVRLMSEVRLEDILNADRRNLIYVYDFLSMWTFYVELADISEKIDGNPYPNLMFAHGQLPDSPPTKSFESEFTGNPDFEDNGFELGSDDYGDFDFDENWN
ncbi:plasmid pRiA4b ORF-3 family protein [Robertkochia flava]|uniref:plasmid pRiA4b ORF-3 family protein n=1 Tax=Robertkochia flava TaxID=3447986 RepID=UPI001CCDE7C6|nr:plasmid pRiA4b ORF-3 family protein [Robertkochia marina]